MRKPILSLVALATARFIVTQQSCDEGGQEFDRVLLELEKHQIISYVHTAPCDGFSECRFSGLGTKACGGPQGYVVYSSSLDTVRLRRLITDYNAQEDRYNRRWGIASTCDIPDQPDSVRCVDGTCVGYWNGVDRP